MILTAAPSLAPAHGNALQLHSSPHGCRGKKKKILLFLQFKKHEIHLWPLGKAGWLRGTRWEKEAAGESGEQGVRGKDMERGCEGKRGDGN